MTSEAKIAANRINAQASTGPRTSEGRARVAQNGVTLGLFAARDIVRPEEQPEYDNLKASLEAELRPATVMEQTLAMEILHSTWRLRRCSKVEASLFESADEAALDPMNAEAGDSAVATQNAVDRARTHARNNLRRATADLSRLQTERHLRAQLEPQPNAKSDAEHESPAELVSAQTITKALAQDVRRRLSVRKLNDLDNFETIFKRAADKLHSSSAKQTQSSGSERSFSIPETVAA